jgi:tetratricopeptide (TPR) repeat protein
MLKRQDLIAFIALILMCVACDANQAAPTSDDSSLETAVSATVSALAPLPTETAAVVQPCPVGLTNPVLPTPTGIEAFPNQAQTYLNQGGSLEALGQVIQDNLLAPHEGLPYSRQDFSGDGWEDIVISILNGDGRQIAPAGTLLLYVCQEDLYQLVYSSPPSTDLAAPFIRAAQDLNGDDIPDLLTTRETCGAHTCSNQIDVLTWNEDSLQSIFPDVTTDIPLSFVDLEGPQEDGSYDVVVTGHGIASVGAGPFRVFSRVWSYDPGTESYQLSDTFLHESNFRIHWVHDADQAVLDGDLELAVDLYERVINDDSLDDWIADQDGASTLAAYAMYRRMLTYIQLGQFENGRAELTRLGESYQPETSNYGYVELAQTLWDEYQASGDVALACAAAREFAQTHSPNILDPLYYGYANKSYVAEDLCPIGN